MNYHFILDDKFLDDFIRLTDPENNIFLLGSSEPQLKHIKSNRITKVPNLVSYWENEILPNLKTTDRVFVHWYNEGLDRIINSLPKDIELGVFFWSGEFTDKPILKFAPSNFLPETLALFNKEIHDPTVLAKYQKSSFGLKNIVNFELNKWRVKRWVENKLAIKSKVLSRFDYIYHWNPADVDWIKKNYENFRAEFRFFYYEFGMEKIDVAKTSSKKYIWLGNSATYSNNHLEALETLKDIKDYTIICPLSYGGVTGSNLKQIVIEKGKNYFGENFVPLLDFLPRDQYYDYFKNIDLVVMNHVRSQAAGNIFMFLYNHVPVFMQPKSSLYLLLKNLGVKNVFDFNQIDKLDLEKIIADRQNNDDEAILSDFLNKPKKDQLLQSYLAKA